MTPMPRSFGFAPMSGAIRVLTLVLLALPVVFLAAAALGHSSLEGPGLLTVVYAWIWLRFRPTRFVVRPDVLEVVWPFKRREIRRAGISSARLIDCNQLRQEVGWGMRVGAGGLWGGFGWLWTRRRGIVQMYISRNDGLVWIERGGARPWLLTPEDPAGFVRALSS
jgi:Bacterial PH domain